VCLHATRAIVSTNAGAGRPVWHATHIRRSGDLVAVSCPGRGLCVAVSEGGLVLASHDPFGKHAQWSRQPVPSALGVTCASVRLCVVVDYRPGLTVAVDPTAQRPRWSTHRASASSMTALGGTTGVIASTVAASCVLGTADGSVAVVHDLAAPRLTARDLGFGEPSTFDGIACPRTDRCIAANEDGAIQVTARHKLDRWTRHAIDGGNDSFGAVACPTARDCLINDVYTSVLSSTNAFGAHASWRQSTIDTDANLVGVACPSAAMCLAFDRDGRVLRSLDPFARSAAWTPIRG
jgi:hypothetical protein